MQRNNSLSRLVAKLKISKRKKKKDNHTLETGSPFQYRGWDKGWWSFLFAQN